jgi:hypothetical protein
MFTEIRRESVATRLERYCAAHGLSCATVTKDWGQGLQLKFVIDGETLTPGEAEAKYLS